MAISPSCKSVQWRGSAPTDEHMNEYYLKFEHRQILISPKVKVRFGLPERTRQSGLLLLTMHIIRNYPDNFIISFSKTDRALSQRELNDREKEIRDNTRIRVGFVPYGVINHQTFIFECIALIQYNISFQNRLLNIHIYRVSERSQRSAQHQGCGATSEKWEREVRQIHEGQYTLQYP